MGRRAEEGRRGHAGPHGHLLAPCIREGGERPGAGGHASASSCGSAFGKGGGHFGIVQIEDLLRRLERPPFDQPPARRQDQAAGEEKQPLVDVEVVVFLEGHHVPHHVEHAAQERLVLGGQRPERPGSRIAWRRRIRRRELSAERGRDSGTSRGTDTSRQPAASGS
ncbi:MAG: hypothetical protein AVDCRST_MAG77-5719 [uncultured Chloroflexi bacterium]|uniref:Uncharacterized protein n=1 Tax=uncultured Chloroflexota bacterium TaxID=166587 RepID=A0A6J4KBX7_9CHLR|nr:MAG: hypothetical protein AVDCRST_MAG77-5719 [uncultured Chloroflexota bacterium]